MGRLTGLASDERIYSVRLIGDRGSVSTFREVDPLFVIDLSRPTTPRGVGQLKIPGLSSSLHPLDAGRPLGIGRDVDPATGRVLGLQLSIFDVSDPALPLPTASFTFPGDGWSCHRRRSWISRSRSSDRRPCDPAAAPDGGGLQPPGPGTAAPGRAVNSTAASRDGRAACRSLYSGAERGARCPERRRWDRGFSEFAWSS